MRQPLHHKQPSNPRPPSSTRQRRHPTPHQPHPPMPTMQLLKPNTNGSRMTNGMEGAVADRPRENVAATPRTIRVTEIAHRFCKGCGEQFSGPKQQRYCTPACRPKSQTTNVLKQVKACETGCGRIILRKPGQAYISRICTPCRVFKKQLKSARLSWLVGRPKDPVKRRALERRALARQKEARDRQRHARGLLAAADSLSSIAECGRVPALLPGPVVVASRSCRRCLRVDPSCGFVARRGRQCWDCRRGYESSRNAPRVFTAGRCSECSEPFVSTKRGALYCSDSCAKRHHRRLHRWTRSKRIRSCADRDPIGLPSLAKRDGWKCHICRKTVTRRDWSIDHLVPLSEGGVHKWENVKLAHFRCNTKRGVKGAVQLLLVGS